MKGNRKKKKKRKGKGEKGNKKKKIMKRGFEMKQRKEHERTRVMKRKKGLGNIFQVRHLVHSLVSLVLSSYVVGVSSFTAT